MTASFGVATSRAHPDIGSETLIADAALYRAKLAGRDRIEGPVVLKPGEA